jgi:hypothetical protein
VYPARTDSAGSYALRYLPPGSYSLVAFQDRNRSREPDLLEMQARLPLQIGTADTLFLNMAVLEADTTPARLARAEVAAPALVRLRFDDYLDPDASLALVGAALERSDGEPGAPQVRQILHEHRLLAIRAAAADSAAPADTGAAAAPPARSPRSGPTGFLGRASGADSTTAALLDLILPSQVLYVELSDTLPFAVEHTVRIQGVPNLGGRVGGADSVRLQREAPPAPPAPPPPPGAGPAP